MFVSFLTWCAFTDARNGGRNSEAAQKYGYPIGTWNVSAVTDFKKLFFGNIYFNEDISDWDMSNAEFTYDMFRAASSFNQPIGKWTVSKVRLMSDMFRDAREFNQPLDNWDLDPSVGDAQRGRIMDRMFLGASSFNQDLCSWNAWLHRAQSAKELFEGSSCPVTSDPVVGTSPETWAPFCRVCDANI